MPAMPSFNDSATVQSFYASPTGELRLRMLEACMQSGRVHAPDRSPAMFDFTGDSTTANRLLMLTSKGTKMRHNTVAGSGGLVQDEREHAIEDEEERRDDTWAMNGMWGL